MHTLFYSLIRLSIGTEISFSRNPSEGEWGELYKTALKQCLLGVCFGGVKRCIEAAKAEGKDVGIPPKLHMQLLASAV